MKAEFRMTGVACALAGVLAGAPLAWGVPATPSPGQLDTSFNTTGYVTTDIGAATADKVGGMAIDTDNPILFGTDGNDIAIVRYNPDGSLDTGFDTDGKVTLDISGADEARAGVIAGTKLYIAGTSNGGTDGFVARFDKATGAIDTTFNTTGYRVFAGKPLNAVAFNSVRNEVVVAGADGNDFFVASVPATGAAATWTQSIDIGTATTDAAYAAGVDSTGKVVVGGKSGDDYVIARLSGVDGSLDNTFATGGKFVNNLDTSVTAHNPPGTKSLKILSDDRIVFVGTSKPSSQHFVIARLTSAGALDSTFNTTGYRIQTCGADDLAYSVAVDSAGGYYVAGDKNSATSICMVHVSAAGLLDSSFGSGAYSVVSGLSSSGRAVGLDSQNHLIVAGYTNPAPHNFVLAHIVPGDSTAPTLSGGAATGTGATTATVSATSDEAGTMYYVVLPAADSAPSALQVKEGKNSTGATATFKGNSSVTAATQKDFSVTGLTAGSSYKAYVVAIDAASNLSAMTTLSFSVNGAPTATTSSASGVTQDSITLAGTVSDNGTSTTVTFDYGTSASYGTNVAATTGATVAANAGSTAVAKTLTGLSCGTTYHYRVVATNSAGTTNGSDQTATTSACPPPPPVNIFNPGGTQTQVNLDSTTGVKPTAATNDLVTNLAKLDSRVGISDNGVVVVLDNGLKEPVKFRDNPPDNVLISMPSQKPLDVQMNGSTLNIKVDPETPQPPKQTILGTSTLTLPDGTQAKGLQLVQGEAAIGNSQPNGVIGGLELSKDATLRGVVAQSGSGGGTAGFKKQTDGSGSVSAESGDVLVTVRLKSTSAAQGVKANALAASDTVQLTLKSGEVARFDDKGDLIGVFAGSLSGTAGKTGDALTVIAPSGLSRYPAKAVKLDGNALDRLGSNLLPAFAAVIGNTSNFAADTGAAATLTQDAATGIVVAKSPLRADLTYYGLPVGNVSIDANTADGIVWRTDGTVTWTVKGVSVTFAPVSGSLTELAASAKQMGYTTQVADNGSIKLSGNGSYLVGLPRFHSQSLGQGAGFAWNAQDLRASYTDASGNTQVIDPVPLDGAQLDATVAAMPGWSIERDYFLYGGVRVMGPQGQNFMLVPDYAVSLEQGNGAAGEAYNGADGRLYYRYSTGFLPYAQGFSVK